MSLQPDRDQIEVFIDAVLRHAGGDGFLSLRSFYEDSDKSFRITPLALSGGFHFLADAAEDEARRAANFPEKVVFCPPIAAFNNKDHARETDLAAGFAQSVECDRNPHEARRQLEDLLGPATIVVRSGGQWIDDDGEIHDKLHIHWRLKQPARSADELAALKGARQSAARLVNADGSNNPICHPIRWPGSWHRKNEPRLCSILAVNPDVEIALAEAVAALPSTTAASPQGHTTEDWLTFLDGSYEGSERGAACARYAGLLFYSVTNPLTIRSRVDPLIVESSVRLFNEMRCKPPLPNDEVHRIAFSVAQRHVDQLKERRA